MPMHTWLMVLYTEEAAGSTPTLHSVMVSNIVTKGELTAAPHFVRSDHSPALDDASKTAHMYLIIIHRISRKST